MTDWLTDTLFATSALMLLVLAIRGPVAQKFGASVAYWLWLLPAARLFMPSLSKTVTVPAAPAAGDVAAIVRDAALHAPTTTAVASHAVTSIDWSAIGLTLWLGGAALLFITQMLRYVALRDEMLASAIEVDQIRDIRVISTDRIGGPLAFGLFRRYIAVPEHFERSFSGAERDLALAHELSHHRSGDLYANLAAFIILCLNWFNPVAWAAWRAFRFDQEAACDARVLAGTDTATRQSYGRALALSAADTRTPALAMAMATNAPATIIRRLRRLTLSDTSTTRRLWGRAAIIAAAAIALPLTATVVPVFAEEHAPEAAQPETVKHKTKIIIMKGSEGDKQVINVSGDGDTPYVKTINKDGKTIILRSSHELSDDEIEKMVADAEKSRTEAEDAAGDADDAKQAANDARADAEDARADAEEARTEALVMVRDMDVASYIPEIDISEVHANCTAGQPVTTDVRGFDGKNKSRVKLVMCGKGTAKLARVEALKGLQEARDDIASEKDMPENVRKSVLESLAKQINRLENQISNGDEPE